MIARKAVMGFFCLSPWVSELSPEAESKGNPVRRKQPHTQVENGFPSWVWGLTRRRPNGLQFASASLRKSSAYKRRNQK